MIYSINRLRILYPITYYIVRNISRDNKFIQTRKFCKIPSSGGNLLLLSAFLWPIKNKFQDSSEDHKEDEYTVLLKTADSLFENGQFQQCYDLLKGYSVDNNNDIIWRTARAVYNLSSESTLSHIEKKKMVLECFELLKHAMESKEEHFAVHKWYAVLLDLKSGYEGIKARINNIASVKNHLVRATELNPNDATTVYIIGKWCYELANMPWHQRKIASALFATPPTSTFEEALEYFLKAESIEPRFYSTNLLMLGKTYLKLKKKDQARYYLNLAASYPAKSNEDHQANKEATDLLKKID